MITITSKYGDVEKLPKPLLKTTSKHALEDQINFLSAFKLMNVGNIETQNLNALQKALTNPQISMLYKREKKEVGSGWRSAAW